MKNWEMTKVIAKSVLSRPVPHGQFMMAHPTIQPTYQMILNFLKIKLLIVLRGLIKNDRFCKLFVLYHETKINQIIFDFQ